MPDIQSPHAERPSPVDNENSVPERVSLLAIYKVFSYIGLMSFGGGLLPWIQREIVTVRGWMTNDDFLPGVALSQVLPGVNSTNLAVFIGQKLRGLPGSVVAVSGILTGPFFVMIIAVASYQQILGNKPVQIAMTGIAAAAIGMIMRTGIMAVQSAGTGILSIGVMVATFAAIGIFRLPLLWVVAIITPLSIAAAWPRGVEKAAAKDDPSSSSSRSAGGRGDE